MLHYDSKGIGEVRAAGVYGQAGVGTSLLCFSLAWNIFPRGEGQDVYTVFSTSVWVSVVREGQGSPVMLGCALPETAWCEESRAGLPHELPLLYRLALPGTQLLALEQMRQAGGLMFILDVRAHATGSLGVRSISETVQLTVNVSDWARALKDMGAADVLLVGVHLPLERTDIGARAAIDLVRKANEHLTFGHYSVAVAECRRAIESLWKSANLADHARAARKLLSTMNDQKSMTKRDRELALGEAVRIYAHNAHHVDADAQPEVFSRTDAALVVATTAGVVSSLVEAMSVESDAASLFPGSGSSNTARAEPARVSKAIEHFRKGPANRPKTLKALSSRLASLFGNKLEPDALVELVGTLIAENIVEEVDGKLAYKLPE
jgi:hypothetical protein